MSHIHKVKVKDKTYHIAEMSAAKQLELYEMLSSRALHQYVSSFSEDINVDIVIGILMASKQIDGNSIQDIGDMVLYQTVLAGETTKVDIEDFQGDVQSYIQLVAEGCLANLSTFFLYCVDQVMQTKELVKKEQEKQKNRL